MDDTSWLPKLVTLVDCSGDNTYYVDTLYQIFLNELVNGKVTLFGKPVLVPSELDKDCRHERFWHTITDPHNPSVSDIKPARAERVPWIKATIMNVLNDEVLVYERKKGKDNRLHLFIPKHKYIIILTERKRAYYFTTAFYIEYTYKLKDYQKEYERYGPKTKTAP
jgi:hypothetical protein